MDQIGFDLSLPSSEVACWNDCERSLDDRSLDIFLVTERRIAAFVAEILDRFGDEKSCFFVVNCPSVKTGAPRLGSGQTNGCENGAEVTMDDEVPLKKSDVTALKPKDVAGDEETEDEDMGSVGMDDVISGGELDSDICSDRDFELDPWDRECLDDKVSLMDLSRDSEPLPWTETMEPSSKKIAMISTHDVSKVGGC